MLVKQTNCPKKFWEFSKFKSSPSNYVIVWWYITVWLIFRRCMYRADLDKIMDIKVSMTFRSILWFLVNRLATYPQIDLIWKYLAYAKFFCWVTWLLDDILVVVGTFGGLIKFDVLKYICALPVVIVLGSPWQCKPCFFCETPHRKFDIIANTTRKFHN